MQSQMLLICHLAKRSMKDKWRQVVSQNTPIQMSRAIACPLCYNGHFFAVHLGLLDSAMSYWWWTPLTSHGSQISCLDWRLSHFRASSFLPEANWWTLTCINEDLLGYWKEKGMATHMQHCTAGKRVSWQQAIGCSRVCTLILMTSTSAHAPTISYFALARARLARWDSSQHHSLWHYFCSYCNRKLLRIGKGSFGLSRIHLLLFSIVISEAACWSADLCLVLVDACPVSCHSVCFLYMQLFSEEKLSKALPTDFLSRIIYS